MKNLIFNFFVAATVLAGMAGCAQTKKPVPQVRAMPTGLRFDQVGRVSRRRVNGVARGADGRNENAHRRGE